MKHKWSLPFLRSLRRTHQRRCDDASEVFRAFVHRLEQMRSLSRSQSPARITVSDKA